MKDRAIAALLLLLVGLAAYCARQAYIIRTVQESIDVYMVQEPCESTPAPRKSAPPPQESI